MNISHPEKHSGVTKVETLKLSYDWTIYNIHLSGKKTGERISSPWFSASANDKYQWRLNLYPKGYEKEDENHLSLYLYLKAQDPNIEVEFEFCILNSTGKEEKYKKCTKHYLKAQGSGFPHFLKQDEILPNKNLIIRCNLTAGISIKNYIIENPVIHAESKYQSKFHDELEQFLKKNEFTDIILIASGKEFHAHKVVLAARSPVFLAMLKNDMKEKAENKIEFVDFDSNVLNEMLQYIYTGKSNNIEKYLYDLLVLAEKYALEGLKNECEQHLSNCLSTTNAIDILELADRYNCQKLKDRVINFMINYKEEVIELPHFKALKDSKPSLVSDLLLAMVQKR